jgi:hypothetical protein
LFASAQRSKFHFTAAALKAVPSWNLIPSRRWKVAVRPSGATSHEVARAGSMFVVAPSNFTRPSKTCSVTRADSRSVMTAGSSFTGSPGVPKTKSPPAPWARARGKR